MRLLIREYLASLRERNEFDAILPDLLSEPGYIVYSRPSRGTRQHGVDVAAVGPDNRLYLFSIKRGRLILHGFRGRLTLCGVLFARPEPEYGIKRHQQPIQGRHQEPSHPCYCDALAGAGAGVALISPERRFSRSR